MKTKTLLTLLLGTIILLGGIREVKAPSVFNPSSNHSIGIEEFNDTWELYNDDDSYFINKSSGIQLTNHYNEYWTKNIFCGGRETGSGILYFCNDQLSGFTWTATTDNTTYAQIQGYQQVSWAGKKVDVYLTYRLGVNDTNLTLNMEFYNPGNKDITENLWFKWVMKDIRINYTYTDNDYIIDGLRYDANETTNRTFTTLNETLFYAEHEPTKENLWYSWNESLTYNLTTQQEAGQYNNPVSLQLLTGPLLKGRTFTTTLYWKDAPGTANLEDGPGIADPLTIDENGIGIQQITFSNTAAAAGTWQNVSLNYTYGIITKNLPSGNVGLKIESIDLSSCNVTGVTCYDNGDGSVKFLGTTSFTGAIVKFNLRTGNNFTADTNYTISDKCNSCTSTSTLDFTRVVEVKDKSCNYLGNNTNWQINMSHYCNITATYDLGTGNFTRVGTYGYINMTNSTAKLNNYKERWQGPGVFRP